MKKVMAGIAALLAAVQVASAFPSWIGVYGNYKRHDDRGNPGQFSVLMNQDYFGLQARVGVQVNGGSWVTYPMTYAGNVQGNSYWTFTPSFQFPGGATVKYYFHGTDTWGGNIWDSRNGLNYEFTTSPTPDTYVQRLNHGLWYEMTGANGITMQLEWSLWMDFRIRDMGAPEAIGILWTDNNWTNWHTATAALEADLGGGFKQYGVDVTLGEAYSHRSLGFIRWYPIWLPTGYVEVIDRVVPVQYAIFYKANGIWYWDNNGGRNYTIEVR